MARCSRSMRHHPWTNNWGRALPIQTQSKGQAEWLDQQSWAALHGGAHTACVCPPLQHTVTVAANCLGSCAWLRWRLLRGKGEMGWPLVPFIAPTKAVHTLFRMFIRKTRKGKWRMDAQVLLLTFISFYQVLPPNGGSIFTQTLPPLNKDPPGNCPLSLVPDDLSS